MNAVELEIQELDKQLETLLWDMTQFEDGSPERALLLKKRKQVLEYRFRLIQALKIMNRGNQ